jgi:beta-glucuronidase
VHLKHGATFSPSDANQIAGYIHVEGAGEGTPVTVRIPEAGVDTHLETDANGIASFEIKTTGLNLWSPGNPRLYKIELAAGVSSNQDKLTDDIGFRDIRVDGSRILLNGKPIFLQGVNAHAEAPYRTGRASTDEDVQNIFAFLKDLNANFVRLAHYPNDERMERMADKQGIMIWSEIPLWQRISFDKPEVYLKAKFMLNEMIRRDRNKASVILWSVSNETGNNPTRTEFLTNLVSEARRLDSTRLITSALNSARPQNGEMVLDDPFANVLDVVGVNEYIGWYGGHPEDADTIRWILPEKPILFSEFGAEAKFGDHGGPDHRWGEEQQVNVLKHQLVMLNSIPQLRGTIPWVLMDFRSPGRNIPQLQDGFNRKGLISEKGERKQSFFLFQKVYADHSIGKAQ